MYKKKKKKKISEWMGTSKQAAHRLCGNFYNSKISEKKNQNCREL